MEERKKNKFTRGDGLLEGFLARKRCELANGLIPAEAREGRLLDIGCGSHPFFLEMANFKEKIGVDKLVNKDNSNCNDSITLFNFDIEQDALQFNDAYFDVVTMLAVLEHLSYSSAVKIVKECMRVLKGGGMLIITTPCFWTDLMLRAMAMFKLVSPEEIEEHQEYYSHSKIANLLKNSGFEKGKMRLGYFELFMNMCVMAIK